VKKTVSLIICFTIILASCLIVFAYTEARALKNHNITEKQIIEFYTGTSLRPGKANKGVRAKIQKVEYYDENHKLIKKYENQKALEHLMEVPSKILLDN